MNSFEQWTSLCFWSSVQSPWWHCLKHSLGLFLCPKWNMKQGFSSGLVWLLDLQNSLHSGWCWRLLMKEFCCCLGDFSEIILRVSFALDLVEARKPHSCACKGESTRKRKARVKIPWGKPLAAVWRYDLIEHREFVGSFFWFFAKSWRWSWHLTHFLQILLRFGLAFVGKQGSVTLVRVCQLCLIVLEAFVRGQMVTSSLLTVATACCEGSTVQVKDLLRSKHPLCSSPWVFQRYGPWYSFSPFIWQRLQNI